MGLDSQPRSRKRAFGTYLSGACLEAWSLRAQLATAER
jgi:hypothetical protein